MQIRDLLTEKRLRQLEEMVALISPQELQEKIKAGEIFQLVDVSDPDDFEQGNIANAINIPLSDLLEVAPQKFRKFQQIVVYCQETNSSVGIVAARMLHRAGFSNVLLLKGGKEAWQHAGFPLQGETVAKPGEELKPA